MRRRAEAGGFTLVEVAIVLVILGVLARALLAPLGERLDERRREATRQRLDAVHRALVGHLATQGVLPCPLQAASATGSATADEGAWNAPAAPCPSGQGGVPAATLGVAGPIDPAGSLLDDWGRPLQYAVSLATSDRAGEGDLPDWTTAGELPRVGLRHLRADLVLCRRAAAGACPRAERRADAIAFVVRSRGAEDLPRDAERENVDGDAVFAVAPPSIVAGQRFDDLLVWASRDELAYWLLRAEWLP